MILKFKKVLKDFPERIIISEKQNDAVYYSFANDQKVYDWLEVVNKNKAIDNIYRRTENYEATLKNAVTVDILASDKMNLHDFLEEERQTSKQNLFGGSESDIMIHSNDPVSEEKEALEKFKEKPISSIMYYTVKTKKIDWSGLNLTGNNNSNQIDSFLHIFIDTTNIEKLKSEQTLRNYQRMMLSSVAHEFRNPLNAIKGNLEVMELMGDKKYEKFIKIAKNS